MKYYFKLLLKILFKLSLTLLFLIVLLFILLVASYKPEYINNRFYLEAVTIRLVENAGIDTSGCAINETVLDVKGQKNLGFAIRFVKKYVSDSTEVQPFLGYRGKGGAGPLDSIDSIEILLDSFSISTSLKGVKSMSYVSAENYTNQSNFNGFFCAPSDMGGCKCVGTSVFNTIPSFISEYNSGAKSVIYTHLDDEVFFWDTDNNYLDLIDVISLDRKQIEINVFTNRGVLKDEFEFN